MHRLLSPLSRRTHQDDERGAVAVIMALSLTGILVIAGMVLDFGLVRVDRQVDKSAADAATLAGLHSLFLNAPGVGNPHPYAGVCGAIRYLQVNANRFSGISSTSGTWTNGAGGPPQGDGCTSTIARNWVCQPGTQSSWAKFVWNGTYQGTALQVTIQSGYSLPGAGWPEDTLPAAQTFQNDGAQGCDQLAVIISQKRQPGLGSLATHSQLVSTIRTVGRVKSVPGSDAPAMLLLKRTGCPVLSVNAAGGGSHIYVYGAYSTSTGLSQPGTVHADADGTNCSGGSNSNIFLGKGTYGIAAFAAPKADGSADPTKPGLITSTAVSNGISPTDGRVTDGNAAGTTAVNPAGLPGSPQRIGGRGLVTRSPIDSRYLGNATQGVTGIVAASNNVFTNVASITSASQALTAGYNKYVKCAGGGKIGTLPAMTASDSLFVDCTSGVSQMSQAGAGTVAFNGPIKLTGSGAFIDLPNATKVYVAGSSSDGVNIGSYPFKMHYSGNLDASSHCSNAQSPTSADRALLVIQNGALVESNGGLFQACYTSVIMMSGQNNGCLPTTSGTAPTQTPCGVASAYPSGTGLITQSGGDTDWTAPNSLDATLDAQGNPLPGSQAAWLNVNGPEDLAFWSETYGTGPAWNMNGTGSMHLVGVVMVPNADPFKIAGGACQNLVNAQYIASSIELDGNGACITMKVDPNAAVPLPQLGLVGLVR